MLTSMAGKGGKGRMESMREMQAQLMNPGAGGPKTKKPTGKRLTPAQKKSHRQNGCLLFHLLALDQLTPRQGFSTLPTAEACA